MTRHGFGKKKQKKLGIKNMSNEPTDERLERGIELGPSNVEWVEPITKKKDVKRYFYTKHKRSTGTEGRKA